MSLIKKIFFTFLLTINLYGQEEKEIIPPDYIKTVIFKSDRFEDQFPIIKLNEKIHLSFDDMYADEADYYYKIEHCNYNWEPSNLVKSQYLSGLDNQRISNYQNSLATLKPYTHYELTLPNQYTKFKISGNYILKIFNTYDELIFSRRFIIYQDAASVGVTIKRSRDLQLIDKKQAVQLTINTNTTNIVNPREEVKIAILQNYNWDTAIKNIKPQFYSGNQLIYKYDMETAFDGGNEYLNFETKEIRTNSNTINKIVLNTIYEHYLYIDKDRSNELYTYNPDINGDFKITSSEGSNDSYEADYSLVHFALEYDTSIGLHDVYVYGKFNNYALTPENKLVYNPESKLLEASILLKQGFYNYKYVLTDKKGKPDLNYFSGNNYQTENNYLTIVYYRKFGQQYDGIIGIGTANSTNITN